MIKWTGRKFNFGYTKDYVPLLIERLNCTAPRIEELIKNTTDKKLSEKPNGRWSVKEHIGHLTDIEVLHSGRIDDYKNSMAVLRAADMTNKKTDEANHNKYPAQQLLTDFRKSRKEFIHKINKTAPLYFETKAFHPRLMQEINLVDILYFVCEHDLQHIATISENLNATQH